MLDLTCCKMMITGTIADGSEPAKGKGAAPTRSSWHSKGVPADRVAAAATARPRCQAGREGPMAQRQREAASAQRRARRPRGLMHHTGRATKRQGKKGRRRRDDTDDGRRTTREQAARHCGEGTRDETSREPRPLGRRGRLCRHWPSLGCAVSAS